MLKNDLMQSLYDAEIVAKTFNIASFELYLMGGSGCIIAGYIERATVDFDFIDIDYSSKLNRVFKMLVPFDMIDYSMASIPPFYQYRAIRINEFTYLKVYVLSPEDIIVSKLGRYSEKDKQDISKLIEIADITVVNQLIDDVINRKDFSDIGKRIFIQNVSGFREDFNVSNTKE